MSSLSPSSNPPRVSDISTGGPPLPPPSVIAPAHAFPTSQAPPAPSLPPTPQPTVDLRITPEPTSAGRFSAAIGNSPYPHHAFQNNQDENDPILNPPQFSNFTPNSMRPHPHIPHNFNDRFNLYPSQPSYAMPERLTRTAPVNLSERFNSPYDYNNNNHLAPPPPLSDNPLPPSVSDQSNPPNLNTSNTLHPPSRPDSVGDATELASSHSYHNEQDPTSPPGQDLFDPSILHARNLDVDWRGLDSSAEPSTIHAGASTHIDETGLAHDFNNEVTRIGQGTYGSVYFGLYFGEHVAIKRIRIPSVNPILSGDPYVSNRHADAIKQFAREIRRYEKVSHPGIVRFYGVTLTAEPSALLVTELMKGGSLGEAMHYLRAEGLKFDISSVVRIALQACSGLRALHDQNCTWGDAKPENILMTDRLKDGVFPPLAYARIADFGLSRSASQTLLADTTIGGSGHPAGSFRYMSPEYVSMTDRDAIEIAKASDIYSFGVVIYEMITLRIPWRRRQMNEVLHDVRVGRRPEWPVEGDADFNGSIRQELKDVVENCWHVKPEQRPTAEKVFISLEEVFKALSNNLDVVRDRVDQEPLSVLADGTVVTNAVNGGDFREQSTVSTVVPIGGGSVELGSQALESTTESRRIGDVPDDFGEDDEDEFTADDAETAPVNVDPNNGTTTTPSIPNINTGGGRSVSENPTVSPVTSPESRSKRNSNADTDHQEDTERMFGMHQQLHGLDRSNVLDRSNASLGTESQTAPITHLADGQRLVNGDSSKQVMNESGPSAFNETKDGGFSNPWIGNNTNTDNTNRPVESLMNSTTGNTIDTPSPSMNGHMVSGNGSSAPPSGRSLLMMTGSMSGEFFKYRNEFAQELGQVAADVHVDSDVDVNHLETTNTVTSTQTWDNAVTNGTMPSSQHSLGYGNVGCNIMASNLSSATSSSRKQRSSNVHSIIEQAAVAFIEYRRQKQSKLTPKQKKEVTDKRAEAEAKIKSEKDSLSVIDSARESGNYSIILLEMKAHRNSQSVVKAGSIVIEKYCADENTFFDVCEEGGVEELVSGAALHGANDAGLSICFCRSILALSEPCNDKVGHIIRAVGAPSLVIEKMQQHMTNIEVQRAACDCLAAIAASSELSRSAVATLGGPAAVYLAMTKNNTSFQNAEMAKSALKAIRFIAQDNEKAAEYLVQVSALDTVSRAAEVFTKHGIECDILAALRAFSFYDGGRRNVIMSSGLKALTSIMVRNTDPEFLVQCCTFIRAISRWRDYECEAAMLESCISSRISQLMEKSNDIPGEDGAKVAWYSSHACTFLASFGSRSRERLRNVGAIETAIKILKRRKENARVVHSATDALAELLKGEDKSKRHAMETCGVIEALNEALTVHRHVPRVRKALEWTLNYLTCPPSYDSQVHQQILNNGQPGQMNVQPPTDVPNAPQQPLQNRWFNFRRKR